MEYGIGHKIMKKKKIEWKSYEETLDIKSPPIYEPIQG